MNNGMVNNSPIRQIIDRKRSEEPIAIGEGLLLSSQKQTDHKALWTAFLDTARSYLPKDIRSYLTIGDFDENNRPPRTLGEFSNFYLVEESIAPVRVMFTTGGGMSYFEVPSIGNRSTKYDWFWETASMFEDLSDALVAADNRFKERQSFRREAGL